ncbi:YfhO family protein, partial [candidate division KSB1 bacterium]|nr:YfhO family protein [candidate division KSB1 bacterium]
LVVFVLILQFAPMVFDGLSPTGTDVIGGLGKVHQVKQFEKETGERPLWNPYVFSGMPLYHRLSAHDFSVEQIVNTVFNTTGRRCVVYYVIGAIGFFFLAQFLGVPVWGAALGSLAFVLMPHYEVLIQAGHFQKFRPLMFLPWVVLTFLYLLKQGNWMSVALFTLAFATQVRTKHYQIVFYTLLILVFLAVPYIVQRIREKEWKQLLSRIGLFSIAMLLTLLMSLQVLWTVKEYAPYSIRGGSGDGTRTGLDYDYATGWSFSPNEMLSLVIPDAYGRSSAVTYKGDAVTQLKNRRIPGYWGGMPSTEGGDYMGVVVVILGVIGVIAAFRKRQSEMMALSVFLPFAFLLSFGNHFPLLHKFFFKFMPYFDKFRVPSMILTVIYFCGAVLAAWGLKTLLESKIVLTWKKPVLIVGIILIVIALFPILFKSAFSFEKAGEAGRYQEGMIELIKAARYDLMKQDALRMLFFTVLACGTLFFFTTERLTKLALVVILGGLLIVDMIQVDRRFLQNLNSKERLETRYFAPTPTNRYLLQDKSTYRIFPLQQDVWANNDWSYYHQNVGGYDPAKLRAYQDVIESCVYQGWDRELPINWNILNMLNAKYLIYPGQLDKPWLKLVHSDNENKLLTYENTQALPRAFFVGATEVISEHQKRLMRMNDQSFVPDSVAILEKLLDADIAMPQVSSTRVTKFEPNRIHFEVETDVQSLLVVSEVYYAKGWTAKVDGQETQIYKTNHILRSIVVPAGSHEVTMEFAPQSFTISSKLSGLINGLILLAIAVLGVFQWKKRRKESA